MEFILETSKKMTLIQDKTEKLQEMVDALRSRDGGAKYMAECAEDFTCFPELREKYQKRSYSRLRQVKLLKHAIRLAANELKTLVK